MSGDSFDGELPDETDEFCPMKVTVEGSGHRQSPISWPHDSGNRHAPGSPGGLSEIVCRTRIIVTSALRRASLKALKRSAACQWAMSVGIVQRTRKDTSVPL